MMNKPSTLPTLAAALVAALCMSAPAVRADDHSSSWSQHGSGGMVSGSGKLQSESRAVGSFRAIASRSSFDIVLRQGSTEAVEVRADDNLLPLIDTRVVDRSGVPTLEVNTKPGANFRTHSHITVTVDVVTLSAISTSGSGDIQGDALKTPALKIAVSGSGDVRLKQLSTDDFGVKISGSGDVTVSGHAGNVTLVIAGSGDVDGAGLEADDVRVSIAGSGDASVNARKTLAVSIAGSGDVSYVGDATVKSSIAGSGSVTRR